MDVWYEDGGSLQKQHMHSVVQIEIHLYIGWIIYDIYI